MVFGSRRSGGEAAAPFFRRSKLFVSLDLYSGSYLAALCISILGAKKKVSITIIGILIYIYIYVLDRYHDNSNATKA